MRPSTAAGRITGRCPLAQGASRGAAHWLRSHHGALPTGSGHITGRCPLAQGALRGAAHWLRSHGSGLLTRRALAVIVIAEGTGSLVPMIRRVQSAEHERR